MTEEELDVIKHCNKCKNFGCDCQPNKHPDRDIWLNAPTCSGFWWLSGARGKPYPVEVTGSVYNTLGDDQAYLTKDTGYKWRRIQIPAPPQRLFSDLAWYTYFGIDVALGDVFLKVSDKKCIRLQENVGVPTLFDFGPDQVVVEIRCKVVIQ